MRTSRSAKSAVRLNCEALEDRLTPVVAYGLQGANLLAFDTATPTQVSTTAITGITAGETLVGIDFRPQNGQLYGLGVNGAADTATLYAISTRTGTAAVVGAAPSTITFTNAVGGGTTDLPDPATTGYGFDFNPAADRIRVVAGSLNFRVNPNNGAPIDGNGDGSAPNAGNGTNHDGPISGATTSLDGSGYTNNQPNTTITTLYGINATNGNLYIQSNPNGGTTTLVGQLTLGGTPLTFTNIDAFDIPAGVNAAASNMAVTTGSGFAVLNVGGMSRLYSVNLTSGATTLLGTVGTGASISGMAIQSDLGGFPAIGLNTAGTSLVRFNTATPGTSTTVAIPAPGATGGVATNEVLAGMDIRPQTGQLYALAVNTVTGNGTLYLVDPQLGTLTAVGTVGQIAFVTTAGAAVPLPNPTTVGYGFDFNPSVDRIRVTTSSGLNFRINPNNGAPVDTDATAGNGINPDGSISGGGSTGVSAAAYTNSFGQPLTTPAGPTTLYTLDPVQNMLFIQNPPNAGTQSMGKMVTVGGMPLDFTAINGFDIPGGVNVATNNAVATGFGYAALVVGGNTILYQIDLSTGAATSLGAAPAGLSGFTMADAPGGTVSFQSATSTGVEGAAGVNVVLSRTGGSGPQTVVVTVTGGSAVAGTDFTGGPYTVRFADGQMTATLNIPFPNDGVVEGSETIVLSIMTATGAAIGAQTTTTVTVSDPAVVKGPAAFSNATIIGNILVISGAAVPNGMATVPVPQGSFVIVSDLDGDGNTELLLATPSFVLVVDMQTGQNRALAVDFNGDGVRDLQIFNPNGTSTFTDGRTGITVTG
jgi:hypothetical protein